LTTLWTAGGDGNRALAEMVCGTPGRKITLPAVGSAAIRVAMTAARAPAPSVMEMKRHARFRLGFCRDRSLMARRAAGLLSVIPSSRAGYASRLTCNPERNLRSNLAAETQSGSTSSRRSRIFRRPSAIRWPTVRSETPSAAAISRFV
jgi:hypothetical protein